NHLQHPLQRRSIPDDVFKVVPAADLLLEVQVLGREPVLERVDPLERERVLDSEGDPTRDIAQQVRILVREELSAQPPNVEGSQAAVPHGQGNGAHRLDTLGEELLYELVRQLFEIRSIEAPGLARGECDSRGSLVGSLEHALRHESFSGELEHAEVQSLPHFVVEHEACVLVRDQLSERSNAGVEEGTKVEI